MSHDHTSFGNTPGFCTLCLAELGDGGHLFAALSLCNLCYAGQADQRIAHRGLRIVEEIRDVGTVGDAGMDFYPFLVIVGAIPRQIPFKVTFEQESSDDKFIKLFKREIQVGDSLFDDSILIKTDDKKAVRPLVASAGFQSAVMESVLLTGQLQVSTSGGMMMVPTQPKDGVDIVALRRTAAVVAHYLDRFALHLEQPQAHPWP